MHNGEIAQFAVIKRKLQSVLPDEIFNIVQGNTGVSCPLAEHYPAQQQHRLRMGIRAFFVKGGS